MADRWVQAGSSRRGRILLRDGRGAIGHALPSAAEPGLWWGYVCGLLFGYFPTRSAAMRAVMVEAASNKRSGG